MRNHSERLRTEQANRLGRTPAGPSGIGIEQLAGPASAADQAVFALFFEGLQGGI